MELSFIVRRPGNGIGKGGGEPSITCAGAVIANAIFDAVGARLFKVPMTSERMRKASRPLQRRLEVEYST